MWLNALTVVQYRRKSDCGLINTLTVVQYRRTSDCGLINTLTIVKWPSGGDVFNTNNRTTDNGVGSDTSRIKNPPSWSLWSLTGILLTFSVYST